MNYLQQINSFNDWLILNPTVTSDDIVLWYALMNLNNISGWQKEFTVAISTIIDRTRLSRSAIYRSRNRLVQLGRINTKERGGNQCSIYEVIPFPVSHMGTHYGTQPGTQFGTQAGTQSGTINKVKETKVNSSTSVLFAIPEKLVVKDFFIKNHYPHEFEKFYDYYESNGWRVGRNKMKDWEAAARNWIRKSSNNGTHQQLGKDKPGTSDARVHKAQNW